MSATCRSCGAAIVWAQSGSGKAMPMDAEPTLRGTWTLWRRGGVVVAKPLRAVEALSNPGPKRFVSHFSTCPNAVFHRKSQ